MLGTYTPASLLVRIRVLNRGFDYNVITKFAGHKLMENLHWRLPVWFNFERNHYIPLNDFKKKSYKFK